jgi:hypothetical protein
MMHRICAFGLYVLMVTGSSAAAQDQTVIVDQPLAACATATKITSATLTEPQAAEVIRTALAIKEPDSQTYYIVHATEFSRGRPTVAEEHWYVYHTGWANRSRLEWLTDSRQAKRFTETRVMGSERVSLVYLYVNVPAYGTAASRSAIAQHFRTQRAAEAVPANPDQAAARARLVARLRSSLPDAAENRAAEEAKNGAPPGAKASKDPEVELIVQLETERYLKAFGDGDKTVADEISFVNENTGEALVGLSPTLATSETFAFLNTLFYKVSVTKKTPAPIDNLKSVAKLAFAGQADGQTFLYVRPDDAAVCAGGNMTIKHIPSDLMVAALTKNAKDEEVQRSKQQFDNEGRYWWDVSLALPLKSHDDLTIDVEGGQVAAKKVEKTDLFAVVNLGLSRDTKKLQWQLVPTFIYGIPITGKPLKHHLVGLSLGLNYVQVIFAKRFDRITEVSTTAQGNTPVGVESSPAQGKKWTQDWVWGINIPVQTVVKLFSKDAKK